MTIHERAYAKINLYLDVTKKRADGYHDIVSVMQTVDLFDEVQVCAMPAAETAITLTVQGAPHLPADAHNLAYRAALAYLSAANLDAEVHITLRKRIPIGAGLGGGSADAAAVLRAMQSILCALDADALSSVAASIGSDVAFCLVGGTALCLGRGEQVSPVPPRAPRFYVLALGGESVSTPEAYRMLDTAFSNFDGSCTTAPDGLDGQWRSYLADPDAKMPPLYNIFEDVIFPVCPRAAALCERLRSLGYPALMSGSGPTVFALAPSRDEAQTLARTLSREGILAISVTDAAR